MAIERQYGRCERVQSVWHSMMKSSRDRSWAPPAVAVHRALGPGFLESLYAAALCVEMTERDIPFQRELTMPVLYREVVIGTHRVDLLVHRRFVVELKVVKEITDVHFAVPPFLLSCLPQRPDPEFMFYS